MAKIQDFSAAADADKIWYFAYGSNMRSSVMQHRGIKTLAKRNVMVPSHRLSFDVFGVPYSEPAMASINASSGRHGSPDPVSNGLPVHGVALLVSHADYVRLLVSEGAGTAYEETELEAIPIPRRDEETSRTILVRTLIARYPFRLDQPPRPSVRYKASRVTCTLGMTST